MAGSPVDLVLYDEGCTRLIKTVIDTPMPLRLKVVDENAKDMRAARRVMLLAHADGVALRADGHLDSLSREADGLYVQLSHVTWELLERRRHVRVPVELPVRLSLVVEGEVQPEIDGWVGTTADMSISGAFVRCSDLPDAGSLVEFSTVVDDEEVRTLAVVAHSSKERGGVGLHFVEYLGNARFALHGFLAKAA
jgi:hypothetical protein